MKTSQKQNIKTGYEKNNKLNSINVKISASFGVTKIIGDISSYGKSASSRAYKLLVLALTIPNQMDKSHKANWTREEEYSFINEIESAGEILRGSGNSADKYKRWKQILRDIVAKLNSLHGNGRAVEDIRKIDQPKAKCKVQS